MKTEKSDNLEKKIKKNIYGKPQSVKVVFPPGLGSVALHEVETILEDLWFKQKYISQCSLLKNEIRIDNIHLFAITELLMRSQCLTDIRLIIFKGKTAGKSIFEKKSREMNWDFYLNKNMSVKIKVDSVASRAFHETGLKEILSDVVKEYVSDIVSGEDAHETTVIYADLYKDKLTMSISLAGNQLYKRGYRGTLSASAPLREDAAACCIQQSLQFVKRSAAYLSPCGRGRRAAAGEGCYAEVPFISHQGRHENTLTNPQGEKEKLIYATTPRSDTQFVVDTVLIPFSGTGTFLFEYLQMAFRFSPALIGRDYALQKMPLFRQENFNFLLKKAKECCLFPPALFSTNRPTFFCIDNSKTANAALLDNIQFFKNAVSEQGFDFPAQLFIENDQPVHEDDFFKLDLLKWMNAHNQPRGNVFIPLNPPYGIRLGKNKDSVALYKNIAMKLNEIARLIQKEQKNVLGFILCPSEETWSAFCKVLICSETETYHFTQGGIDIRVCQFIM